jgi:phage antirepressor YoqD-like protein
LYSLILSSKLPKAKDFKRWVTSEILPTIRKHGAYITGDALDKLLNNPASVMDLLYLLKNEREKKEALIDYVEEIAPKARYHDIILQCSTAIPVSVIAKDYGMTAVVFNKLLHSFRVQYKVADTWLLYKEHSDKRYTVSRTYHVKGRTAAVHTYWTQRGRKFIYELLKYYGILPQIELAGVM